MPARPTIVLVTLALLGGCLTAPEKMESAVAERGEPQILEELRAQGTPRDASATLGDWFVTTVLASPETGLSSFEWTVPPGAVVPWAYNDDFNADETVVALEVALLTRGAEVTTWGFLSFEEYDGFVVPGDGHAALPMTITPYGALASLVEVEESYSTDPVFITLSDREANETIRFVFLARSEVSSEVGLAFRILDHDPTHVESESEPAGSPEAFLASRGATPPVALPSLATATGFAFHAYADILFGGFTPGPTFGIELVAGEPSYSWNLPPAARAQGGVHTLEASVGGTFEHGYSLVSSSYFSMGYGVTSYTASATLHGETESVSGLDPDVWITTMTPVGLRPGGDALGAGDGEGTSSADLTVERLYVPGLFASASVVLIEFGATAEELVGSVASPKVQASDNGGPVAPSWLVGSDRPTPGTPAFRLWSDALRQA